MKMRCATLCLVVLGLAGALALTAAAQPLDPPVAVSGTAGAGPTPFETQDAGPLWDHHPLSDQSGAASNPSALSLGAPGLSFRYLRTFGETEHAYLADNSHLNFPYGLGSDGSNVWVVELFGDRALKYGADGTFLTSIGTAGFWDSFTNFSTGQPTDVAVDAGGNAWIAYDWGSHVGKFDASGKLVGQLGSYGSGNGQFQHPTSVAFDAAGNVYVSDGAPWWGSGPDEGNQRVQIFDAAGHYRNSIGTTGVAGSGPLQFHGPRHIAIYGNQLFVADVGNHRVQIIDISNPLAPSYVATLGTSGQSGNDNAHLNRPTGVAVDATYIYVADTDNQRIQIFNRGTHAYVTSIGAGEGAGEQQFRYPSDVTIDGAGHIYVADLVNCRVQVFDSARQYVRTLGTVGVPYLTDGYHYNMPTGVAVAPDGSVYLTEDHGQRLVKLSADGTSMWAVGAPGVKDDWSSSPQNDRWNQPQGVWTDGSTVYVADQWHGRVQIYGTDGSYRSTIWGLDCPRGVTVRGGVIYVANTCDHTVRIYNQALTEIGHLGVPGQAGNDDAHFDSPSGVVIDSRGLLYVADTGNNRVQVFDGSHAHLRTIGQTGASGSALDQLNNPQGLAVDATNRLYVADNSNNRVQIFSPEGAYLTTIGGGWGKASGQLRGVNGVAVDGAGNVYVTDWENHRIQKFAPGVPGWRQVNINGFGDVWIDSVTSFAPFGGKLYVGAGYRSTGGHLWQLDTSDNWTAVTVDGFGDARNQSIDHLAEFKGQLYAGTANWDETLNRSLGGEIWRSPNGTTDWSRVVSGGFDNPLNAEIYHLSVFSNTLYATTWSYTNTHDAEIWSSGDGQNWTQVVDNGLGDPTNVAGLTMEVFDGALYAGTRSLGSAGPTGCEVWRTGDGLAWTRVIPDGFGGNQGCYEVASLTSFQGYLYAGTGIWNAGTQSYPGGEVWRCSAASGCDQAADWERVVTSGFGNPDNANIAALLEFDNHLWAFPYNFNTGFEAWRTANGTDWEQVSAGGLTDSNNVGTFRDNSVIVFNEHLYLGTYNPATGGQVWRYLNLNMRSYLPVALNR